jgi:ubiquitin-protein ligase/uncharacterized protein YegL
MSVVRPQSAADKKDDASFRDIAYTLVGLGANWIQQTLSLDRTRPNLHSAFRQQIARIHNIEWNTEKEKKKDESPQTEQPKSALKCICDTYKRQIPESARSHERNIDPNTSQDCSLCKQKVCLDCVKCKDAAAKAIAGQANVAAQANIAAQANTAAQANIAAQANTGTGAVAAPDVKDKPSPSTSPCTSVQGECGHSFHTHCFEQIYHDVYWNNVCPSCQKPWAFVPSVLSSTSVRPAQLVPPSENKGIFVQVGGTTHFVTIAQHNTVADLHNLVQDLLVTPTQDTGVRLDFRTHALYQHKIGTTAMRMLWPHDEISLLNANIANQSWVVVCAREFHDRNTTIYVKCYKELPCPEPIRPTVPVLSVSSGTVPTNKNTFSIDLKTLQGVKAKIDGLTSSTTVEELKTKVHAANSSWIPCAQRLIFGGKILEDSKTLGEYGLETGSAPLFLVINPEAALRGAPSSSSSSNSIYQFSIDLDSPISSITAQLATKMNTDAHKIRLFEIKRNAKHEFEEGQELNSAQITGSLSLDSLQTGVLNVKITIDEKMKPVISLFVNEQYVPSTIPDLEFNKLLFSSERQPGMIVSLGNMPNSFDQLQSDRLREKQRTKPAVVQLAPDSMFDAKHYLGWQPFAAKQTDKGISCALSALYMLTHSLKWDATLTAEGAAALVHIPVTTTTHQQFLKRLEVLPWLQWPKAALHALSFVFGKLASNLFTEEKQLISNMLFITLKTMTLDKLEDGKVFEASHIGLSYVARYSTPKVEELAPKVDAKKEDAKKETAQPKLDLKLDLDKPKDLNPFKNNHSAMWTNCLRQTSSFAPLATVAPGSLSGVRPPRLTRNANNAMIVFVGRPKGDSGDISVWNPVLGDIDTFNAETVAASMAASQDSDVSASDLEAMMDRQTDEAMIICLDVSDSMKSAMKFVKPEKSRLDRKDEDEEEDEDPENPKDGYKTKEEVFDETFSSIMYRNAQKSIQTTERKDVAPLNVKHISAFIQFRELKVQKLYGEMARAYSYDPRKAIKEYALANYDSQKIKTTFASAEQQLAWTFLFDRLFKHNSESSAQTKSEISLQEEEGDDTIPKSFLCPISCEVMKDPVITSDGFTYDRASIELWLKKSNKSPLTGTELDNQRLIPNREFKSMITARMEAIEKKKKEKEAASAKAKEDPKVGEKRKGLDENENESKDSKKTKLDVKEEANQPRLNLLCLTSPDMNHTVQLGHQETFATLETMLKHVEGFEGGYAYSFFTSTLAILNPKAKFVDVFAQEIKNSPNATVNVFVLIHRDHIWLNRAIASHYKQWISIVNNRHYRSSSKTNVMISRDDTTECVKLMLWKLNCTQGQVPSEFELWTKFEKTTRDGCSYGAVIRDNHFGWHLSPDGPNHTNYEEADNVTSLVQKLNDSGHSSLVNLAQKPVHFYVERATDWHRKEMVQKRAISRLEVSIQMFGAFLNRLVSYDLPKELGLITFGSSVQTVAKISPFFEQFRSKVDRIEGSGDTHLYDAIKVGCESLLQWRDQHNEKQKKRGNVSAPPKLRLIVLTDGEDCGSKQSAIDMGILLQRHAITLDSIQVGCSNSELTGLTHASKGLVYVPNNMVAIYNICESDTFLDSHQRKDVSFYVPQLRTYNSYELSLLGDKPVYTDCASRQKVPDELNLSVTTLAALEENEKQKEKEALKKAKKKGKKAKENKKGKGKGEQEPSEKVKLIMQQMRLLTKNPHPAFDIYPTEDDLTFWKVIMEGPDSTPYKDGVWQLYIHFAGDYPNVAPIARFVTPIRHCNVNGSGRICYSLLDRNWSPETTIITILQGIYSLMLNPSKEDPLDSVLAQRFYEGEGRYEAEILEHVKVYAKKTRKQWEEELVE